MKLVEQLLGAGLILLILTDVFLTVLYARADTGLISRQFAHGAFVIFAAFQGRATRPREGSSHLPEHRDRSRWAHAHLPDAGLQCAATTE
jgi:hypothetical protein